MRKLRDAGCVAAALAMISGGSGFALELPGDTALSWVQEPDHIWSVDSSDAGDKPNFYSFVRIITVSGGQGPVVQFSCQATDKGDYALNAGIKLEPANTYDEAPKTRLRFLEMNGTLTIGDDRKNERFQYHPDSSKIVPYNRSVPRRLFNAVVRGNKVKLKVQNQTHDLDLPGPDEIFKAFATICPVTNGGKFDHSIFDQSRTRPSDDASSE